MEPPARSTVWTNWSRTVTATPVRTVAPADVDRLRTEVSRAAAEGLHVRMVGSGHSFTGAAVTDGVMLRPDHLSGIVSADAGSGLVTVLAGTPLHVLGPELARRGLAMANLGDIDRQTISGALSTGTHGTGARLGGLASQVAALELVLPTGELVRASTTERPELFDAARVGLGAFGVLATVTLRCVPAFSLHAVEAPMPLDAVLSGLDELVDGNDHFEFYWFPHTKRTLTKRNNRLQPGEAARPLSRLRGWVDDELLSNTVFEWLNRLTTLTPAAARPVSQVSARALSARDFTDSSYRVFASSRRVVFREMEYAVARADVVTLLTEVDGWVERSGERLAFPVEVRFAAAEDAWLSTSYGRETAYVAVHQYHRRDHERYFRAVEEIATGLGGRPHWGKLHFRDAADLRAVYPRFDDALAVRAHCDPDGVFLNAYLRQVLGVSG